MTYSYSIEQDANLTNATGLQYSYYWTAWVMATITIYAGEDELYSFDDTTSAKNAWTTNIIDVSAFSGNNTIKFYLGETYGNVKITDVSLLPLGTATPYITDSSKSFTPDEHIGRTLTMTSGTAKGQSGTISTNTADTMYLPSSFPIQNVTAGGDGTTIDNFEAGLGDWTNDDAFYVGDKDALWHGGIFHTGANSVCILQGPE